jgi:hypothetical protein
MISLYESRFHVEAGKFTEVVEVMQVVACDGDDFIGADYLMKKRLMLSRELIGR